MFGSEFLDIGIGVALLFLFVSLMCTAAREALETVMKSRSKDLERGIRELLDDPDRSKGLVKAFYKHPLIYSLFRGPYDEKKLSNLPSYIPSANFAGALIDMVKDATLAPQVTSQSILSWVDPQAADLAVKKFNLAAAFDATMDRVSGVYKRRTQVILFIIGLGTAIVLNIDAIAVIKALSTSQALRDAAVAQAEQILAAAEQDDSLASVPPPADEAAAPGEAATTPAPDDATTSPTPDDAPAPPAPNEDGTAPEERPADTERGANQALLKLSEESYADLNKRLDDIGYPIGWKPAPQAEQLRCGDDGAGCIGKVYIPAAIIIGLGWLITALAVMLGAPFWFDVLNKFMVIRSTVKPHEKSPEEGSEDRASSPNGGRANIAAGAQGSAPAASTAGQGAPGYVPNSWKDDPEGGVL